GSRSRVRDLRGRCPNHQTMGPSVAHPPQGTWVWLRRNDSNLQSPDPESGGLPISRLLSSYQNIAKHRVSRHRRRGAERRSVYEACNSTRGRWGRSTAGHRPLPPKARSRPSRYARIRSLARLADCEMAQGLGVAIAKGVTAGK